MFIACDNFSTLWRSFKLSFISICLRFVNEWMCIYSLSLLINSLCLVSPKSFSTRRFNRNHSLSLNQQYAAPSPPHVVSYRKLVFFECCHDLSHFAVGAAYLISKGSDLSMSVHIWETFVTFSVSFSFCHSKKLKVKYKLKLFCFTSFGKHLSVISIQRAMITGLWMRIKTPIFHHSRFYSVSLSLSLSFSLALFVVVDVSALFQFAQEKKKRKKKIGETFERVLSFSFCVRELFPHFSRLFATKKLNIFRLVTSTAHYETNKRMMNFFVHKWQKECWNRGIVWWWTST